MYAVKNIRAATPAAVRERRVESLAVAKNSAKATSEFFHGVYEVSEDGKPVCYYVNVRRYFKIDTALARA